jgi:hypothetical protein
MPNEWPRFRIFLLPRFILSVDGRGLWPNFVIRFVLDMRRAQRRGPFIILILVDDALDQ